MLAAVPTAFCYWFSYCQTTPNLLCFFPSLIDHFLPLASLLCLFQFLNPLVVFYYFVFPFQRVTKWTYFFIVSRNCDFSSSKFSLSVFKRFNSVRIFFFSFSADHSCWVDLCRSFFNPETLSFKHTFSLFKEPAGTGVRNPFNFRSTNSWLFFILDFGSICRRHLVFPPPRLFCLSICARSVNLKAIRPSLSSGFTSAFSRKLFFLFRGYTSGTLNVTFFGIRYMHTGASSYVFSFVGEVSITLVQSEGDESRAKNYFCEVWTSVLIVGFYVGTEPRLIFGISVYSGTRNIGLERTASPLDFLGPTAFVDRAN